MLVGTSSSIRRSTGYLGHEIDVTDDLRRHIRADNIDVLVKDELWGGRDPVMGQRKRLRVAYSDKGGGRHSVEITEKDRLKIP